MEGIKDRLETLLKILGLKPIELARKTGIPKSTIYTILSGASTPSKATISLISKTLNVNPEWLKTGNGKMFLEEEDIKQSIYFPVIAKVGDEFPQNKNQVEILEYIAFPMLMNLDRNKYFVVKMNGDSMKPILQDGDYVITKYHFNDALDIPNKKIVIVKDDNGELHIRRLYKGRYGMVFMPDNLIYEPLYSVEGCKIVGTVWEVIARRKL